MTANHTTSGLLLLFYIRIETLPELVAVPICFGGFADMNYGNMMPFKSATGVFDCTCFKAPTQAQFPRVYN
jgi:hypothetical protein